MGMGTNGTEMGTERLHAALLSRRLDLLKIGLNLFFNLD